MLQIVHRIVGFDTKDGDRVLFFDLFGAPESRLPRLGTLPFSVA